MASKLIVNLDTNKNNYVYAKCKQNDNLILEANIYENGTILDLENKEILIQAGKKDTSFVIQNTDIIKQGNKIKANLDRAFTTVPGMVEIEIVLVESGKQNTTFSFYLDVIASSIKTAIEKSNTITILEELENKVIEAVTIKEETENLIKNGGAATKGDIATVNSHLEQIENTKATNKKVDELQGQLDNLVLESVEGGSNSEVVQARGSEKLLNDRLTKIETGEKIKEGSIRNKNLGLDALKLIDQANLIKSLTDGGFVNYGDGTIQANNNYSYTDYFIKVTPGDRLYLSHKVHYALYDASETFKKGVWIDDCQTYIDIPSGCYNLKVSPKKIDKSEFRLTNGYTGKDFKYILPNKINNNKVVLGDKMVTPNACTDEIVKLIPSKNLFNPNTITIGKFVNYTNGQLTDNVDYITSDFIDISQLDYFKESLATHIAFYDAEQKFTRGIFRSDNTTSHQRSLYEKYVRVSINIKVNKINEYQLESGTTTTSIEPFKYTVKNSINGTEVIFPSENSNKYKQSRFYGKKVSFYGTSITQGGFNTWCKRIIDAFGFIATNNGVGGTAICKEEGKETSSMCTKERMLGQYGNVIDENNGQITYDGIAIPSDVEVIFVEGGTNDCVRNWEIGNKTFSENPNDQTFAGACHKMFKNMTELFQNAEIIVIGSPFGKMPNRLVYNNKYGVLNNHNLQTTDYGDVLLEIGNKWGIKGINMGAHMQIHDNNVAILIPDGLHLTTEESQKRASEVIINYLLTLN